MKIGFKAFMALVLCSTLLRKVTCIDCFECFSYKSEEDCEKDLWVKSPCAPSYDACVKFQVVLKPRIRMNEKSLTGYGRGCGYESQCLTRPQTCVNFWGKDSSRRLIMEVKAENCTVECCQKNLCHTPADKRPQSPYRTGQSKKTIYEYYNTQKGARALSHGVKSALCAGILPIGLALYLLALLRAS